jgi:uncharacterized protein YqeY
MTNVPLPSAHQMRHNPWQRSADVMDPGEFLTRWTVRLALALYVLSLILRANASLNPTRQRGSVLARRTQGARLAWTAGYGFFLLHVACAFQYYHHWSHRLAYEATARRTAEAVGLDWGGGLFANYAFTLLWGLDVCWWWYAPACYRARSRGLEWMVQGFLAFMAFNGAVVFGAGAARWLSLLGFVVLAGIWGRQLYRSRKGHGRSEDAMSLKNTVREKFEDAKRSNNREEKNVLSVILGDISTAEARSGKEQTDAEVEKLLRKMVESNTETLTQLKSHHRGEDPRVPVLEREIGLLKSLLPKSLDVAAIAQALEPVRAEIQSAKSDGQATGLAMKHLKTLSLNVQGQDVAAAVKEIRTSK